MYVSININKIDNDLCRVHGIGPQLAKKLVDKGIMSIEDLKKHKEELNSHQLIGLKYVHEFEERIPRKEVALFEEIIRNIIMKLDKNIIMLIGGSYRRGSETSGDIDVLITQPKTSSKSFDNYTLLPKVISALEESKIITDRISLG